MKKRRHFHFLFVLLTAVFLIWLCYGTTLFQPPGPTDYPVHGVDVSAYQGEIDWPLLADQDIQFAFIKATEGSNFQDVNFAKNFQEANKTKLRVGAYHFFSYDSSGLTQAENFIATVPKQPGMLPPVVDVEFYGDKDLKPPKRDDTQAILTPLLQRLEEYYGVKPLLYATQRSYQLYIAGTYTDYDIWIWDATASPELPDQRPWTFWQYSHQGELAGYQGEQKQIDLNVFCGTPAEFARYGIPTNT